MSLDHASATRLASLSSSTRPQLKRKRDAIETERVHENVQTVLLRTRDGLSVRRLNPVCLLPRGQLPLAWLDFGDNGIQHLTGDLPMLEIKTRNETVVVIAEDTNCKRLVAVERAGSKAYALCRLSASIDQRVVRSRAVVRYNIAQPEHVCAPVRPVQKRQHLLTPPPRSSSPVEEKVVPVTTTKTMPGLPRALSEQAIVTPLPAISVEPVAETAVASVEQPSATNAEDMQKELTKQYLDTLYLTRTSIAYFVKGPLSRARHAAASTPDLSAYLREMLLSMTMTDKRQRDTLPGLINDITNSHDASGKEQKKARKSKWKAKRDKTGLLHDEKQHVQQWWQHDQDEDTPSMHEAMTTHISKRLQSLRKRETFLQVTLLLEAMISEGGDSKEKTTEQASTVHEKKRKKDLDLQTLLEALLDRLTIWHSVDFKSPDKKGKLDDSPSETHDELRSFCTEVIIPFYLAKLPKTASFVNKKLGGPSTHSPSKRKSSTRKPGEPTKRSSDKKRPSMRRTTTDSSLPQRSTPALERSATDSQLHPRIKREQSVSQSLSQIPAIRPGQLSQALASLSRREIDLTAVSTATESRLRRKAEQEAKVKEAVASIRRPDRALALKENAALVDATFAKNVASKKSQSGVHIAATPVIPRYIAATPSKQGALVVPGYTTAYLAPPQLHAIPQTGHRERVHNHSMLTPAIDESEDQTSYAFPADLNETPILSRTKSIDVTPVRLRAVLIETPITKPQTTTFQARLQTPLADISTNITTTPLVSESVYDVLGWNNDDYEPLA